jgi:diaminobutyrate-2-oxoglutarate transaminase
MRLGSVIPHAGVTRLPFDGYLGGDIDTCALLAAMLEDSSSGVDAPAAVMLETVQGEGGLNVASPWWLRRVATLAREHGALLIVDDIQAGCGRTGTFFSTEPAGVVPDIVVLSKSLSGFGLPMSVVLVRPELDVWRPGQHTGTFRGNAHAFVTAAVALRKFWSNDAFVADVARRGAVVHRRLTEIAAQLPDSRVKGRGMMLGVETDAFIAAQVNRLCARDGLIIERCGPRDEVLKVLAPLTTPDDVLEQGLDILADAVRTATQAPVRISA